MASKFGFLGSLDMNTGDTSVGWDTDQFLMDSKLATLVMYTLIQQNGLEPGGLNFDCKIRRESSDPADLFIAHIAAMDTLAFALKKAAQIHKDNLLKQMLDERYLSYETSDLGKRIDEGTASLQECESFILKNNEPKQVSGKQEKFERVLNNYFV